MADRQGQHGAEVVHVYEQEDRYGDPKHGAYGLNPPSAHRQQDSPHAPEKVGFGQELINPTGESVRPNAEGAIAQRLGVRDQRGTWWIPQQFLLKRQRLAAPAVFLREIDTLIGHVSWTAPDSIENRELPRDFCGHTGRLPAHSAPIVVAAEVAGLLRSEERRVGKECRSRWS